MRTILAIGVLVCLLSPALACMQPLRYKYDRVQELAAIDEALLTKSLERKKKAAIQALRNKVSASLMDLSSQEIQTQFEYRSRAMELLGLKRIPYRPNSDFEIIDRALANMKDHNEKFDTASQLRIKAESQWAAKEYDAAQHTLFAAQKVLRIKHLEPGC
jgi:hypothetical protein